jgi:HAD superfamily hydrolase (TIGR01509 family)
MTIDALIFDCDGLLIDTETPDFEVWADIYAEHGAALSPERWMQGLGTYGGFDPCADLEALLGRALDSQALRAASRARLLDRCAREPLRPGVTALLEAARSNGLRLAVASSSDRAWVEHWLGRHAIRHYFACVRTRDDVPRVKPAPDLFLSAAAALGIAPERCVVFEDSPNGMRAAAAAGMRCVAVPIALLAAIELPPVALRLRSLADLAPDELLARLDVREGSA